MKIGEFLFKMRGYIPIPFLAIGIFFAQPQMYLIIIGLLMILTGEFMRIWGVSYAGAATRTREAGAAELVTNGPFAYVRNPLYIGNILLYVGAILMTGVWSPYFAIIVFIFFYFQYTFIVLHEEEKLKNLFGDSYSNYKNYVNRFIPKFKPYNQQSEILPEIKKALKSEKSTFISMSTFLILLLLRIFIIN